MLKYSHNDYKNKTPFTDGLLKGATIFEADLLIFLGSLRVGHSWLEYFLSRINGDKKTAQKLLKLYLQPMALYAAQENAEELYLVIDIKTGSKKVIEPVIEFLKIFQFPGLHFAITAGDNWFSKLIHRERKKIKDEILKQGRQYGLIEKSELPEWELVLK